MQIKSFSFWIFIPQTFQIGCDKFCHFYLWKLSLWSAIRKKLVLVFSCTIALLQKTKYLQIGNNIKWWISACLRILLHKLINIMFMYHLFSQLFHEYKPEISNFSNRINTYLINRWNTYTFYIGDSQWCKNIYISNCVCEKMFIAKSQNKHLNLV